ncbi:MAG: hypothetical protein O7D30_06560 [Rickettsia endosymbiont of Ixodes persulcatus]|nr:hypothetical protein [Rickettsia endosymbiont of Ixodes persulcatus]
MPFHDMLKKRQKEELICSVYGKPAQAGHYLQFDSNHPTGHEVSEVRTLLFGLRTICLTKADRRKGETIFSDLKKNSYASSFIHRNARCMIPCNNNSTRNRSQVRSQSPARTSADHCLYFMFTSDDFVE